MRYDEAGPLTGIDADVAPLLADLPSTPLDLCRVAQGLVVTPDLSAAFGIPVDRDDERSIRPTSDILRALRTLDGRPIDRERAPSDRVVGTCRHFSVLACALLRHRGVQARSRCGFAAYFVPGKYVDHWIVEHRRPGEEHWTRVDPEVLGFDFVAAPDDLAPGDFLTGGEAWARCRTGEVDPADFGVHGHPDAWGIGEVRGNAVRDLAALNKVEVLPWDEWGRMHDSYDGRTGADYDELMDVLAVTCASDDDAAVATLYASEDLTVPAALVA